MFLTSRTFSFTPLSLFLLLLSFLHSVSAIKFNLPAFRYPPTKCIWNTAHAKALVIVTANVGPGPNQRVDIEIVDSEDRKNIYLSKKGIKGETRLAITTHSEGDVGVCLKNYIDGGTPASFNPHASTNYTLDVSIGYEEQSKLSRVIDLDIDIGADAVDYKCVCIDGHSYPFLVLTYASALLQTRSRYLD